MQHREAGIGEVADGPAVASLAVARHVGDKPRAWRVLGTTQHGWWAASGPHVLAIGDDTVVRLPNMVVVRPDAGGGSWALQAGDRIMIGDAAISGGGRRWRVVRWWDAEVRPTPAARDEVAANVRNVAVMVGSFPDNGLASALHRRDAREVLHRAIAYVGRGPGLTPEGDDYVAGVCTAYRHVAASVCRQDDPRLIETICDGVVAAASRKTTLLSAALLAHACRGEVATPVGLLLRSLTGRGDVMAALAATNAIGHTSGPAMVRGIISGTTAALGSEP